MLLTHHHIITGIYCFSKVSLCFIINKILAKICAHAQLEVTFELEFTSGMDLFRQVLGGGDRDDGEEDGMEEEALLLHGADSSSSSSQEDEGVEEDSNGPSQFDVSLPARHLVSELVVLHTLSRAEVALLISTVYSLYTLPISSVCGVCVCVRVCVCVC